MSGFAGIFGLEDKNLLKKMLESIKYRGPDDQGTFVGENLSIGHVRLSIIDLSKAGQNPLYNEDESIFVVKDGRIFNFQSLRRELEECGHKFQSRTDTEVIVHAYEEWGLKCIKKFNGTFSFALFNRNKKKLFLCRDPFGCKPFFYALKDNLLFFASEKKALIESGYIKPEINKLGLYYYLSFMCTPSPITLYKGIKKIPPGHYLEIDSKKNIEIHKYYDLNNIPNICQDNIDIAIKKNKILLRDSIDKMMYSDVPQGVSLSGGVDSSTLVAFMSEIETEPIETFSIGMAGYGDEFNELKWARLIHEKFETNHHEYLIEEDDVLDLMRNYLDQQSEFIVDPACLLTYQLSKEMHKNNIKVVHLGEAADEIYCGYPTYLNILKLFNIYNNYNRSPYFVKNIINFTFKKGLKSFEKVFEKRNRLNLSYFLLALLDTLNENYLVPDRGIIGFSEVQKEEILRKDLLISKNSKNHIFNVLKLHNRNTKGLKLKDAFLQDTRFLEFKIRLPELISMRIDYNTMLHSIEARAPFFDKNLIEYNMALSPPSKKHYKNSISKYILKTMMKDKLPKEILYRKKIGLATPISWVKSLNFSGLIENEFSRSYMKKFFKQEFLTKMIKDKKFRENFAPLYPWIMINFSFLYRKVILNEKIVI